ncbi:hypothetical protein LINPERHAP2_LOCUS3276 [Linum perenne]
MSRKIPQIWAKKGGVRISDVGWEFFVVKFDTIEDYDRAMFGGPWMVGDHYVVIQTWRPYFRPEDSTLSTLRVWIRLPGLPLEYFDYGILKKIGDRIGTTVRIDHTTLEEARGNFARLCVEVDLSKPLLSKYRLRRRVRRIEYEGLHTIYIGCGCYGHEEGSCTETKGEEDVAPATMTFSNPMFRGSDMDEQRPEVEEDFGPWMKVKRQPRRSGQARNQKPSPAATAAPSREDGDGKNNNSFTILEDLVDGAYLGNLNKESRDSPQWLGSSDNKENEGESNQVSDGPHLRAPGTQREGLVSLGGAAADPLVTGPKGSKAKQVDGPAKGFLRLGLGVLKSKEPTKASFKKANNFGSKLGGEAARIKGQLSTRQGKPKFQDAAGP